MLYAIPEIQEVLARLKLALENTEKEKEAYSVNIKGQIFYLTYLYIITISTFLVFHFIW